MNVAQHPTLWSYFRRHWLWFVRGGAGGVGYNTLIVLGPIYLGRALDALSSIPAQGWDAARPSLVSSLLSLVVMTVVFQGARTVKRYDLRLMSNAIGNDLRRDLLRSTLAWDAQSFERENIGDLVSRGVGDIDVVVETIMTTVTEFYDTLVLMLSYFVAIVLYDWRLALVASVPVPLTIAAAQLTGPVLTRASGKARRAAGRMTSHAADSLAAVRVLRLYGREAAEWGKFKEASLEYLKANLAVTVIQSGLLPFYAAAASLGVVVVIGTGATRVIEGAWTLGRFAAYLSLFLSMTGRTLMAARVLNRVHAARAAWARVMEKVRLLEQATPASAATPPQGALPSPTPTTGADPPRVAGAHLVVSGLSFCFPGTTERVLRDISFEVMPGDLLAVTGPIGGGKSALISALSGLYPYAGSIRIDGVELRDLGERERANLIAPVDQTAMLFSGSVVENATMFRTSQVDQWVKAVARDAAIDADVAAFPKGYDTDVGASGARVSGGQRQRIALARALYQDAPLLLLDDPFSAVDLSTERLVVSGLRSEQGRRTIVLCSHRLSVFEASSRIIVLKDGKIVEEGTHEALLSDNGLYARIHRAQGFLEAETA